MAVTKSKGTKTAKAGTNGKSASKSAIDAPSEASPTSSLITNRKSKRSFRFLDLPAELRQQIYEEVLHVRDPLDLDPDNFYLVHPRLALFLVSKQIHEEAYRVFYAQSVRLFPKHGRFFHTKKPLLARLPNKYRSVIRTADLLLGPGWSAPPKCQVITPSLGLEACTNIRTLKIFVSCDPSDGVFDGFRGKNATEDTYKWFCVELLQDFLEEVPSLRMVVIDANPGVKKNTPLILGLLDVIRNARLRLVWGATLLNNEHEKTERNLQRLNLAMNSLSLDEAMSVVRIQA